MVTSPTSPPCQLYAYTKLNQGEHKLSCAEYLLYSVTVSLKIGQSVLIHMLHDAYHCPVDTAIHRASLLRQTS